MSKHDNIYNILGKLASLEPKPAAPENILKQLNESAVVAANPLSLKDRLAKKLAETKEVEEDLLMPKEKKFAALAEPKDKITYADKIAGAKKDDKKKVKEGADDVVPEKPWVKHPEDPASKVPAFQRKANEPGRQAAQDNADAMNASSGAAVFRSGRPAPMEEEQYDENNAHSSLPGTRRVTDEEHSEYDAAAHTIRKWMRKRGWDPKSEFKPAMKYIIDNLEEDHDDTLTDEVKMAACTCHKHHSSIEKPVEEGFPTVDDARKRAEQEKGTGKFDVQKTSTGTRYTRKPETFDDDGEEGSAEKSDGPKKKGRPAKNKGPERTTSKAWKHKGARVTEAINLETYVEDTMAEIQALFIIEKDMGKHNNATTGFKALAKKAGGGEKGQRIAGAQFQKMKKAGQLEEGVLTESSLQAIVRKFGKEVREFAEGGDIDQDLFEALYDYYFDDMPYGVKKSRDGDPYEWIGDHFHEAIQNGDVEINETKVGHRDLDELAALAGIGGGQQIADEGNEFSGARAAAIRAGKDSFTVGGKTFHVTDASDEIHEAQCNMTAEGQMCPVHGMVECGGGMMYESEELADKDYDEDGKVETGAEEHAGSVDKAIKKAKGEDEAEELEECGVPVQMGGMGGEPESGMSINTSMDTKTGRKTVTVTADGDAAEELAQMLKMAGMAGSRPEPQHKHVDVVIGGSPEEVDEEYANEPNIQNGSTRAIMQQGNDLNKSKTQYKHSYKGGDNPMSMKEDKLFKLYDAMKTK